MIKPPQRIAGHVIPAITAKYDTDRAKGLTVRNIFCKKDLVEASLSKRRDIFNTAMKQGGSQPVSMHNKTVCILTGFGFAGFILIAYNLIKAFSLQINEK